MQHALRIALLLLALALGGGPAWAAGADEPAETLTVADPYLELRSGPGRGYPVVQVAERGEPVQLLMRRTDWYKLRNARGHEGWVQRAQLQGTLTAAGERKSFRDLMVDDFLGRRVELGAAWGRFGGEPMLKMFGHVRLGDALGVELAVGQVQGLYSGTDFWHLSATVEPWSDRRLSPQFSVGLGQFRNFPNRSLVGVVNTDARLAHAGLGLRWYLGERFVAHADWTIYTAFVSDPHSREFRALTAGLSFFF